MLLTIVKFPEKVSFSEAARTIDESGGTIGRAKGNDWVLDDPERFLSSRHAQISCDDGSFYLTDLSTNGTFLNGAEEPVGKGNRARLQDGDRIAMGEYEFEVSLWSPALATDDPFAPAGQAEPIADPVAAADPDPWAPDPWSDAPASTPTPSVAPPVSAGDSLQGLLDPGGEVLDPLEALDRAGQGSVPQDAPLIPGGDFLDDWSSPAAPPEASGYGSASEHAPVHAQSMRLPQAIPEDWDLDEKPAAPPRATPAPPSPPPAAPAPQVDAERRDSAPTHRRAPQVEDVPPEPPRRQAPPPDAPVPRAQPTADVATVADDAGVAATLFEALGVDASRLSATEQKAVATVTGQFLREAVAGLIRVLGSRSSIKNEFRMSVTTIQPVENNPLKFSATVDDAIELMFVKRAKAYKPPLEAVREGFDGIADHQIAVIAGMRAAFESILRRFDPQQLQQRFDRQQKGGIIPGSKKGRYWESFEALYEDLTRDPDEAFQMLFGDEFVQSYESQLTRLAVARKRNTND